MTDAEVAELLGTYLDAVKKLHPDINPDLPPSGTRLQHWCWCWTADR